MPQHRGVLAARHGHVHDPGRHVHAPLRLLQRQDGQAHVERSARASPRGAERGTHGPETCRHHERRPRRPPGLRRARLRRRDPPDKTPGPEVQGRGPHPRLPWRGDAARQGDRRAARRVQPQRRGRPAAVRHCPPRLDIRALDPRPQKRQGARRRRGHHEVRPDGRPGRVVRGNGRYARPRSAITTSRSSPSASTSAPPRTTSRSCATGTRTSSRRWKPPPTSSASSTSRRGRSCGRATTPTSTCPRRSLASARSPRRRHEPRGASWS